MTVDGYMKCNNYGEASVTLFILLFCIAIKTDLCARWRHRQCPLDGDT